MVIVSDPSSGKVFAQRLGVSGFKHLHIKFLLTAPMEQRRDCCHLCTSKGVVWRRIYERPVVCVVNNEVFYVETSSVRNFIDVPDITSCSSDTL